MKDAVRIALTLLKPFIVKNLTASTPIARKAQSLVLHDQLLTGFPRDRVRL